MEHPVGTGARGEAGGQRSRRRLGVLLGGEVRLGGADSGIPENSDAQEDEGTSGLGLGGVVLVQ